MGRSGCAGVSRCSLVWGKRKGGKDLCDLEQLCGGSGERGVSGDGTVYWEKNRKEGCGFVWKRTEKRTEKIRGLNDRRHLGAAGFVACWILLTLSGCSAKELEARDFVSVLTVPDGDTESLLAERQRTSTCTLDYSHTKAVILDTILTQNPEQLDNVLETLLSRPEFAWNLLVFTGDEETLRRADEKKEKLGLELAAYYKNHTAGEESGELVSVTLLDLWNWRTGSGEELSLPVLSWQEDNLIPEGVLIIKSPCSFPKRDLQ